MHRLRCFHADSASLPDVTRFAMQRHPVSTPLALLLGAYMSLCTPAKPRHVVTGLLMAGLATRAAAAAGRLAPEPLTFAARVISASAAAGELLFRVRFGCCKSDVPPVVWL